jgi:uncharacterized protein YacL
MLLAEDPTAAELPRIPSDVFVEVVRLLIVALATTVGDAVAGGPGAALGACSGYVAGGVVGRSLRRATGRFEAAVDRTPAITVVAGAIGALAASVVGIVVGIAAIVLLPGRWGYPVLGITAWTGVYAGFQVGARKGSELLRPIFGRVPTGPIVLVDSSAAMDSRLLAITRSGFLPGELAVPRFVLDELQGLTDASDATRRRRAHRGLETLEALDVVVLPDEVPDRVEVDAKLIALGHRLGARVLTADRGLAAVAAVEGVTCLDVASLTDTLRSDLVPGEVVSLRLTRAGRDPGQAVGYLADGTMVVVSDSVGRIGEDVDAELTTSVSTPRGRLWFARLQT